MSLARKRRRWKKWDRYIDRIIKLSPQTIAPPGSIRAWNEYATYMNRKNWKA